MIADGGDVTVLQDEIPNAQRFTRLIQLCFSILDKENGSILQLPYQGGFMEQPVKTMEFLLIVQQVMVEAINTYTEKLKVRNK